MKRNARVATVAFALFSIAGPTLAQELAAPPGFGVGAAVGFASFSEEIDDRQYGGLIEGTVRYTLNAPVQIATGAGFGFIDVDQQNSSDVLTLFAAPRLFLKTDPGVAPYIGARLGYVRQSLEIAGTTGDADGFLFGGEFGVLIPLSSQFALETGLVFGGASMKDLVVDGTPVPDSEIDGATLSLRAGGVLSFPR